MNILQASVIIPTYNGNDKLMMLLQSLEKQTCTAFEVLVVIDGSTDNTLQKIESVSWNLNALKLIEQTNKGRAGARNSGAQRAQSELLIFFDDDMIVDAACIEKHIEAHTATINRIVMGQVIEPSKKNDPEIRKYKDFLNQSWAGILKPYALKNIPAHLTILSAQNMSVSVALFKALGGFNETLKDIEDYDLALRAKTTNIPVYYLNTAISVHNDFFNFKKYALRSKAYLKNRRLAASLNPGLYATDTILAHKHSRLQQLAYAVLRYPFWLTVLDSCNIFTVLLPKKLRYKLYGIIITAYAHYGRNSK